MQGISFATGAVIFLVAVISILQEPYSSMAALVFDILSDKILLSTDGTSVSTRLAALGNAFDAWQQTPFLGLGLGDWSAAGMDSPMNWYVMLGSETGIIGLVLVATWIALQLINSLLLFLRYRSGLAAICVTSLLAGVLYFVFVSTFQNFYFLASALFLRSAKLEYKRGSSPHA